MPPDPTLTKEWPMAGQPPEGGPKETTDRGDGGKRKRPAEFAPPGRRGDDSITRNLKRVYEQVASEPVPPDLMKLLDQLGDRKNGEDDDV